MLGTNGGPYGFDLRDPYVFFIAKGFTALELLEFGGELGTCLVNEVIG